jgi:hypothetical protein
MAELLAPLARLEALDALAGVDALTAALHQATGALTGAAAALNDAAAKLVRTEESASEQIRRLAAFGGLGGGNAAGESPTASRVVRFPAVSPRAQQQEGTTPEQAPRGLLSLPLIIRTPDGSFIPAGGRARGPFSLNDLKAILAHSKLPPDHYVMQWQRAAGGWWLLLEQPQAASPRPLRLLLREFASQRGMSVAELVQFLDQGESVPPAQFCGFVDSLSETPGGGA